MSDRVVIDGDASLTSTIDGEGNAFIRLGQNPIIEPLEVTENGTYEVPDGVEGFNPVTVHLPKAMTADQIATGEDAWGDLTIEAEYVIPSAFKMESSSMYFEKYAGISKNSYYASSRIRKIVAPNCVAVGSNAFYNRNPEEIYLPKCVYLGGSSLRTDTLQYGGANHSVSLRYLYAPVLEMVESHAFGHGNGSFKSVVYPRTLRSIYSEFGASRAETAIFLGTPTTIGQRVFIKPYWPMLTDIYVPWSEGEVANAPWGATTATIHYDTPLDDFAASWDGNLLQQEVIHPM